MTGMKHRTPKRARRRGQQAALERLNHAARTFKAAARMMRALTGLIWWSVVPLALVGLVLQAVLTGSVAELLEVLVALRPG